MKKILITGSYGTGNVGDEVILHEILNHLEGYEVTVVSQGVEYTKMNFPTVKVINQPASFVIKDVLKDILLLRFKNLRSRLVFMLHLFRNDIFWVGGGGLLSELRTRVLRYYCHQIRIAHFFKCKVVFFALGIGPLRTEEGRLYLKETIDKGVSFISVRDEHSKNLLREIGIQSEIIVIPDPAFNFNIVEKKRRLDTVVINFYPTFNDEAVWPGQSHRFEKLQKVILDVSYWLVQEKSYKVIFLPFGTVGDLKFAKRMKENFDREYKAYSQFVSVFDGLSYSSISDQLINCRFNITMRFHAGLLSLASGVPSICIDQQYKSERLLNHLSLDELLILFSDGKHKVAIDNLELELLKQKVHYIEQNESSIVSILELNLGPIKQQVSNFWPKILRELNF